MHVPLLDLKREHVEIRDELQSVWNGVLERMHLFNGENLSAFEREIAAYVGVPYAVGVASGTDALLLALEAAGVEAGDRVILPANAFVAALEAIYHLRAVPVLVDVAADGFAPDPEAVAAALPARALIVVHLYGAAFDLGRLLALCAASGTALIEDASHAHGATRNGRRTGSMGLAGCFSAGVVKNLASYGDAGFVTTADAALADAIRLLQRHGQREKNDHARYGYNSRMDELHAAVLRLKLRHLDRRNARRRAIAAYYGEVLAALPLRTPQTDDGEEPVYHQYVVRTAHRDRLREHLRRLGVETGIHYPLPLHRQPAWLRVYGEAPPLPRCERLAREILSLPVFPDLTDAEVEHVARSVRSFFA